MSTPTIRAALARLVELSKRHAVASVWDGAFFNARAALKAAASGDGLAPRVLAMCKQRKWSLHWTSRGAYLHLEASELIEALRGKRGDPLAEAADVLLVLMSITENAGIDWSAVVQQTAATCSRLEACDQYPGEERMDSPAAPPAPLPQGYIDPEHQGDGRELLETFYGACNAEGGTADEIHLRGIKAVLAARPAAPPAPRPEGDWFAVSMIAQDMRSRGLADQACGDELLKLANSNRSQPARPAAPAAPEPGELGELVELLQQEAGCYDPRTDVRATQFTRAATLLSQPPAPAPAAVPVAVAERPWEREGWCDEQGRCWFLASRFFTWSLESPPVALTRGVGRFLSLPHHAIPLPQGGEGES